VPRFQGFVKQTLAPPLARAAPSRRIPKPMTPHIKLKKAKTPMFCTSPAPEGHGGELVPLLNFVAEVSPSRIITGASPSPKNQPGELRIMYRPRRRDPCRLAPGAPPQPSSGEL
jgi:hypothetical protein